MRSHRQTPGQGLNRGTNHLDRRSASDGLPCKLFLFASRWLWDCPSQKHTCTVQDKEYSLDETASGIAAYHGDDTKRKATEAYFGLASGIFVV